MAHAKMMHSFQLCFCQFPILVPRIFPSEQFSTDIIGLVQRATDECLKTVVDVEQVGWKQRTTLVDNIWMESSSTAISVRSGNRGRHGPNGVRIATHGYGQPQCFLGRITATFEISLDGNGHTALTGHVKAVYVANIIKIEVKIISYLLCDKMPYHFLCTERYVFMKKHTASYGLCPLDALWMVMRDGSRDACQLQCLFQRIGI